MWLKLKKQFCSEFDALNFLRIIIFENNGFKFLKNVIRVYQQQQSII